MLSSAHRNRTISPIPTPDETRLILDGYDTAKIVGLHDGVLRADV